MEGEQARFETMALKVHTLGCLATILGQQRQLFDLQPYKLSQSCPLQLLSIYRAIASKPPLSSPQNAESWCENQRRLFVWFVVCQSYFMKTDNPYTSDQHWEDLGSIFFGKSGQFMHFQFLNLRKGRPRSAWTSQQDRLLVDSIEREGVGRWKDVAKRLFYDSRRRMFRSPKHCRERWLNHLDMNKKRGQWTTQQDYLIVKYSLEYGKRWCKIVPLLEYTRTEHMIKNRYNSLLSKHMTNRKQREEDVARRMCRSMLKSLEKDQPAKEKPNTKQSVCTSLTKIEELSVQQQVVNQPSSTASVLPTYSMMVMNFSPVILMNPIYYQLPSLPISKQSNFSPYI